MLFNLFMIGLLERLNAIEGVHHTIYADDITIWVCDGGAGEIEQWPQKAVEVVEEYLVGTGLVCSPEKSELLLYCPTLRGRPPKGYVQHAAYKKFAYAPKTAKKYPRSSRLKYLDSS